MIWIELQDTFHPEKVKQDPVFIIQVSGIYPIYQDIHTASIRLQEYSFDCK